MAHRLPADFHLHTHHSGDCDTPMEMVIEQAIEKNLPAICITEHMDLDYIVCETDPPGKFEVNTDEYHKELLEFKDKYKGKLDIYFGIELGLQPQIVDKNNDYLRKYTFDIKNIL